MICLHQSQRYSITNVGERINDVNDYSLYFYVIVVAKIAH